MVQYEYDYDLSLTILRRMNKKILVLANTLEFYKFLQI